MTIKTGSNLKEWREKNRVSRKLLAEKTGYTQNRIAHVECNNEPLSDKLKTAVVQYDGLLNPPPFKDDVSKQWDDIKDHSNFCQETFEKMEKALLDMLTLNYNKLSFDGTEYFFKLLATTFKVMSTIRDYDYSNPADIKNDIVPLLNNVLKETKVFFDKKGVPKSVR